MNQSPVQDGPEGAVLTVHVQSKAARTEYVGIHGDALKFRVSAPPIEGAANEALCSFLAERFGLSKGAVVVRTGLASRRKQVLLTGVPVSLVRDVLAIAATRSESRRENRLKDTVV
jgi:uncharacterized protein (TIGR00251 family)